MTRPLICHLFFDNGGVTAKKVLGVLSYEDGNSLL